MIDGFFRQHWAGSDEAIGPAFRFDNTNFRTTNSITPTSGVDNEITISVWIKPQTAKNCFIFKISEALNDDYAYLYISSSGNVLFNFGPLSIQNNTSNNYINFNSWNHILVSIQAHGTGFTFGKNTGDSFNYTTKISTTGGTDRGDRAHLIINSAALHKFAVPIGAGLTVFDSGPWTTDYGYFRNDFAFSPFPGTGFYQPNYSVWQNDAINSVDLFTSDGSKDTMFGGHLNNSNQLVNYYEGDIYQFWLKNTYYDLFDSANIDLFRINSTTPKTSLPSSPLVYFEGSVNGIINSGSLDVGTITNNGVTSSPTP